MIKVNYRALGMLSTNCYVVENPDSQKVLIVDPGDSPLEIERQIDEIDGDPEAILLTHGHFDHMLAADALRKKYHIPVYVHEKEQHLLGDPKENLSGLWSKPYTMQADKTVKEGDVLHLADFEIHVLATPGHTAGGVCYYIPAEKALFSGDYADGKSCGRRQNYGTDDRCRRLHHKAVQSAGGRRARENAASARAALQCVPFAGSGEERI